MKIVVILKVLHTIFIKYIWGFIKKYWWRAYFWTLIFLWIFTDLFSFWEGVGYLIFVGVCVVVAKFMTAYNKKMDEDAARIDARYETFKQTYTEYLKNKIKDIKMTQHGLDPKIVDKIKKIHALAIDKATTEGEKQNAQSMLDRILKKHKVTLNQIL